jgi:hypothetical protein
MLYSGQWPLSNNLSRYCNSSKDSKSKEYFERQRSGDQDILYRDERIIYPPRLEQEKRIVTEKLHAERSKRGHPYLYAHWRAYHQASLSNFKNLDNPCTERQPGAFFGARFARPGNMKLS